MFQPPCDGGQHALADARDQAANHRVGVIAQLGGAVGDVGQPDLHTGGDRAWRAGTTRGQDE